MSYEKNFQIGVKASPDEVIRLWPEGPPSKLEGVGPEVMFRGPVGTAGDAAMLRNVSEPTLSVFRPAKPNGVGVIVCPGGGWRILTLEHEGIDVARRRDVAGGAWLHRLSPEVPRARDARGAGGL